MTEYSIPIRTRDPNVPEPDEWHLVHGFGKGWGYDNRGLQLTIWFEDVRMLLGFPMIEHPSRTKLLELHEMLQQPLEERRQVLIKHFAEFPWPTKLSLPRLRRPYPL